MNVLIVEDNRLLAKLLKTKVESLDHQVEIVVSGRAALQKVKQTAFDLVLLDIFLPDYHGVDLIPQFKEIQPIMGIVAMTGHNSRELELEIRALGIFYYLIKPFDLNNLKKILDHISSRRYPDVKEKKIEIQQNSTIENKITNPGRIS